MYKRVEAGMVLTGVDKKELARVIGVSYNTLLQKLRGDSDFTLNEALKIKEAINSSDPIELLFERSA